MGKKKEKHNKYAALSAPEAEYDFHGIGILTKDEIRYKNFVLAATVIHFNIIFSYRLKHSKLIRIIRLVCI